MPLLLFACGGGSGSGTNNSDTVAPAVTTPASINLATDSASGTSDTNTTIATFLSGASAMDNLDGVVSVTHDAPAFFPVGTTTIVTFSASDAAGNTGMATATVAIDMFNSSGSPVLTGYLIDSFVDGVEYFLNGNYEGITNNGGSFYYYENDTINFKIGEVDIGFVTSVSNDNRVTLQDICGIARNWSDHPLVIKIATFLQSLDDDSDPTNGISITQSIRETFIIPLLLKNLSYSEIVVLINNQGKTVRSKDIVRAHLEYVMISAGITPLNLDENTIPPYYDSKIVGLPPNPSN